MSTPDAPPPDAGIARWVRPELLAFGAYQVPDATGFIKLDAMENPYPWPEPLVAQWTEALRGVALNRYPDPRARHLAEALRRGTDIPETAALMLGNGSDELIQMLALTVAAPDRTLLSLEPSFVMYRYIASFAGLRYVGVPLNPEDFSIDLPATLEAIARAEPALVFLSYPNNPTGNRFDAESIVQIIEATSGLVIIDEAYGPFTDSSFLGLLGDWPNLLVLRTLSKMGLAGLRLGYLAGPPAWLEQIDKVRLPYNINILTQVSCAFALQHKQVFETQAHHIRLERGRLFTALQGLDGFTVYPSEANFILLRTPEGQADAIFEGLKAEGILIKNLNGSHPLLRDCLRLTVGRPEENEALRTALAVIAGRLGHSR